MLEQRDFKLVKRIVLTTMQDFDPKRFIRSFPQDFTDRAFRKRVRTSDAFIPAGRTYTLDVFQCVRDTDEQNMSGTAILQALQPISRFTDVEASAIAQRIIGLKEGELVDGVDLGSQLCFMFTEELLLVALRHTPAANREDSFGTSDLADSASGYSDYYESTFFLVPVRE